MIYVVSREDPTFLLWKKRAYEQQLYHDGWYFHYLLATVAGETIIDKIAIEAEGELLIGIAIVWCYSSDDRFVNRGWPQGEDIGCYIKPEFRRKGYGRKLVNALGGVKKRHTGSGEPGSELFWKTMRAIS